MRVPGMRSCAHMQPCRLMLRALGQEWIFSDNTGDNFRLRTTIFVGVGGKNRSVSQVQDHDL